MFIFKVTVVFKVREMETSLNVFGLTTISILSPLHSVRKCLLKSVHVFRLFQTAFVVFVVRAMFVFVVEGSEVTIGLLDVTVQLNLKIYRCVRLKIVNESC